MPVAVIGGWLWSYSVSKSVVNLGRLAKHFQNRVLTADGTDGTCESQIVALPRARVCLESTKERSATRVRVPTRPYR